MSYVARIILNQAEVSSKRDKIFEGFCGIYGWHKAAWQLFPDMPDDERKFLFRLDEGEDEFRLTVASKNEPRRPDWCLPGSWLCRMLTPEYFGYKKYLFKLYVNPTRTTRKSSDQSKREKKHGRHEAILRIPELRAWLVGRAEQNGFRILEAPELDISPPVFHPLAKNGYEGTVVGVDFKGALEVTKRESFRAAFEKGLGRARSFGFGLLVVQPI